MSLLKSIKKQIKDAKKHHKKPIYIDLIETKKQAKKTLSFEKKDVLVLFDFDNKNNLIGIEIV